MKDIGIQIRRYLTSSFRFGMPDWRRLPWSARMILGATVSFLCSGLTIDAKQSDIGEATRTERFEITVDRVMLRWFIADEIAHDGGVYVVVNWKYRNISKRPVGFSSKPTITLVDDEGFEYSVNATITARYDVQRSWENLNPGLSESTVDIFEVSKEQFDPLTWTLKVRADKDVFVGLVKTSPDPYAMQ